MFSTLDPVTRRIELPSGPAGVAHRYGRIHPQAPHFAHSRLPRHAGGDIRIVPSSCTSLTSPHRNAPEQVTVVESILDDMDMNGVPTVMALNKADLLPRSENTHEEYLNTVGTGPETRLSSSQALTGVRHRRPPLQMIESQLTQSDALLAENLSRAPPAA